MSTPVIVMVNYPWLVMDSYGMAYLVSLSPSCDPESSQFFTIRREDKHVQQPDWLSNENHLLLIGIYTHVYTCKLTGKPTICSFSPKPWVFCIFLYPGKESFEKQPVEVTRSHSHRSERTKTRREFTRCQASRSAGKSMSGGGNELEDLLPTSAQKNALQFMINLKYQSKKH